jgi:hypothetical protein
MPVRLVTYRDYRLSTPPVHVNKSDFQRFAPEAIAAGWLPSPDPPSITLNVEIVRYFPDGENPSGLLPGASILPLLDSHFHRLHFSADSGDYSFAVVYRSDGDVLHVPIVVHLETEGFFCFSMTLSSGLLVVGGVSSEDTDPALNVYAQTSSLVDVTLSGPLVPDTGYLAIRSVSGYTATVLPAPTALPQFIKYMSVLSSSVHSKSIRFAYSCSLGPLTFPNTAYVDLNVTTPASCTWSYVELKFASSVDYQPFPIPVVVGLVTIPSKPDGTLAYDPVFYVSNQDDMHQLYSPPEDLLLFTWVTDSHGAVTSPRSFTLDPLSHLLVVAIPLQSPDEPPLYVTGIVSGNVSYA